MTRAAAWAWTVVSCAVIGVVAGAASKEFTLGLRLAPILLGVAWLLGWPPKRVGERDRQAKMLRNPNGIGDGGALRPRDPRRS